MDEENKCFRSGDVRVNEHPGLVKRMFFKLNKKQKMHDLNVTGF
jgi:hypothetical protein